MDQIKDFSTPEIAPYEITTTSPIDDRIAYLTCVADKQSATIEALTASLERMADSFQTYIGNKLAADESCERFELMDGKTDSPDYMEWVFCRIAGYSLPCVGRIEHANQWYVRDPVNGHYQAVNKESITWYKKIS